MLRVVGLNATMVDCYSENDLCIPVRPLVVTDRSV